MPTRRPFVPSAPMPLRPSGPGCHGGASSLLRTSLGASARLAPPSRIAAGPTLLVQQRWASPQLSLFGPASGR